MSGEQAVTVVLSADDYAFLTGFHPDRDRTASRADMVRVIEHMQDALAAGQVGTGAPDDGPWRVGEHYRIHVYEGDRPVATFHHPEDAVQAVADREAVRRVRELLAEGDEQEWNGTTHNVRLRRALDGVET